MKDIEYLVDLVHSIANRLNELTERVERLERREFKPSELRDKKRDPAAVEWKDYVGP